MKKLLKKENKEIYYYKNDIKIIIDRNNISTYPSELSGNISSGLYGNISRLYGNISGIYGNISGISGNIDNCEITDEERKKGIDINDLIGDK